MDAPISETSSSGFRRRILIEPGPDFVVAELEDDWHRMTVELRHHEGVIVEVVSDMKRWPWTTCPGAVARLAETFTGVPLRDAARRGERTRNCTHLHDLALFAAGHAEQSAPVAYEVRVSDPVDGRREAMLDRDGLSAIAWRLEGDLFLEPADLSGRRLNDLGDLIADLDPQAKEATRILRWAAIMAYGRAMDLPAGVSATVFPPGACFTFQPDQAREAVRRGDVHRDFSLSGQQPLADRASIFRSRPPT